MRNLKIAIVHEWLTTFAGSERVVEQFLKMFPDADLFVLVDFLPEHDRAFLKNHKIHTTFIQKLPFAKKLFRNYLPLMPLAIEQFDFSSYDIVLSSNHAVAKGAMTGPNQVHISYVHSPIRYAWDLQSQYLAESGLSKGLKAWIVRMSLHYMRLWDTRTVHGVDRFIANSRFIARRIKKTYGRQSQVIYPPVDVEAFHGNELKGDFFLTASRMVPYKKMPLIVEAFAKMPQHKLVVIGDGPDLQRCKDINAPNVTVLGYQPFKVLRDSMLKARAFVFAAEEDFGITLVESQAAGTPVIAYGRGGALETIRGYGVADRPTGIFFEEQTTESIINAVERFVEAESYISRDACIDNSRRFAPERFREEILNFVMDSYDEINRESEIRHSALKLTTED